MTKFLQLNQGQTASLFQHPNRYETITVKLSTEIAVIETILALGDLVDWKKQMTGMFLEKELSRFTGPQSGVHTKYIDKLLTCPGGCRCPSQNIQYTPIRIAPFLGEASDWSANQ